MRVVFICGSLEPGRDGVGDYVRCLAETCTDQGAACLLVALNDGFIAAGEEESTVGTVQVLRISAQLDEAVRCARLAEAIRVFAPDWISVQFVSYAFYRRGLIGKLGAELRRLAGSILIHLMVHELWVSPVDVRSAVLYWLQRRSIVRFLRELQPRMIHTQTNYYVELLRRVGWSAERLPLFSSIPPGETADSAGVLEQLSRQCPHWREPRREHMWWLVFFGVIHPECDPTALFALIEQAAHQAGRQVVWVSVGRLGALGEKQWRQWSQAYGEKFVFVTMGEAIPKKISGWLQAMDAAVAVTPARMLGKSSSAMTFLDHGLPLLLMRDELSTGPNRDDFGERNALLIEVGTSPEQFIEKLAQRQQAGTQRTAVARQLLQSLAEA